MTNKLFIHRCKVLVTTMKAGNCQSVSLSTIAKWLESSEHSAYQFLQKAIKFGIIEKKGNEYKISDNCSNSIKASGTDISAAVDKVVEFFINNHKPTAKVITTTTGRKLVKVESKEKVSAETQNAIDHIISIIKERDDLKAEVELLREELEKTQQDLTKYKTFYKQIR